jgi:hypothetical protein
LSTLEERLPSRHRVYTVINSGSSGKLLIELFKAPLRLIHYEVFIMRKWWSALWLLAVLLPASVMAVAQFSQRDNQQDIQDSSPGAVGTGYGQDYIPDGTRFVAQLKDKLQTAKVKPGKHFTAVLGEDLIAPDGDLIPRGNKIQGHVSSSGSGLHGHMILSFDQIETRYGWVPLAATVTGLPGEHGIKVDNAEGEIQKTNDSRRIGEGAVAGAAVGVAAGAAAGGGHGALAGAGAGAALGGAAALLTDRNLVLDKNQQLEVRLDRPLQLPSH